MEKVAQSIMKHLKTLIRVINYYGDLKIKILGNLTFQIRESKFIKNIASISGGAIFFATSVLSSFDWKNNSFFENIAKYYGNDWASPPFRLCLTNTNVSDSDYNEGKILKLADPFFKLQSHVLFDMEYLVWIVDQFFQPAFSDPPMLLNLSS